MCKRILVLNKSYSTISKPCITPELWNRQHSTVVIFEDTKHIVVGLFNSPTTIKQSHDDKTRISRDSALPRQLKWWIPPIYEIEYLRKLIIWEKCQQNFKFLISLSRTKDLPWKQKWARCPALPTIGLIWVSSEPNGPHFRDKRDQVPRIKCAVRGHHNEARKETHYFVYDIYDVVIK